MPETPETPETPESPAQPLTPDTETVSADEGDEDEAELPEDAATLDADLPGTTDTAEVVEGPSVPGLGGIVIAGADGS